MGWALQASVDTSGRSRNRGAATPVPGGTCKWAFRRRPALSAKGRARRRSLVHPLFKLCHLNIQHKFYAICGTLETEGGLRHLGLRAVHLPPRRTASIAQGSTVCAEAALRGVPSVRTAMWRVATLPAPSPSPCSHQHGARRCSTQRGAIGKVTHCSPGTRRLDYRRSLRWPWRPCWYHEEGRLLNRAILWCTAIAHSSCVSTPEIAHSNVICRRIAATSRAHRQ